ncbi:hypothetical protein QBC36DRAFT_371922 [Triangularia setosa]|uniref:Uncharacterized protein n=1 Tax=Triangularia setosa TaxID=2587417 RepID=A0AAN7A6P9_9PEZI|nr:hypothetical protein QBC36DRAFT_371922 [Podospora setosa]
MARYDPFLVLGYESEVAGEKTLHYFIGGFIPVWRSDAGLSPRDINPAQGPTTAQFGKLANSLPKALTFLWGRWLVVELPTTDDDTFEQTLERSPRALYGLPFQVFYHNGPLSSHNLELMKRIVTPDTSRFVSVPIGNGETIQRCVAEDTADCVKRIGRMFLGVAIAPLDHEVGKNVAFENRFMEIDAGRKEFLPWGQVKLGNVFVLGSIVMGQVPTIEAEENKRQNDTCESLRKKRRIE